MASGGGSFGPGSDIDFFIVSDDLVAQGVASGARATNGALRVGATPRYFPQLAKVESALATELGRPVSIRVFGNLTQVDEYDTGTVYATTTYGYDKQNNLTTVTDNDANVTNIVYDLSGRKTSMTDPDLGTWTYTYDNANNLTSQVDGRGQAHITFCTQPTRPSSWATRTTA